MPKPVKHIGDLTPDPKNARRHSPRNIGAVVNSLHRVGFARSIVIDENGVVLAGNGTLDACAEAGIEKVVVVPADGNTVIAVQRTGLTERQKAELAIADNRTNELSGWDAENLAAVIEQYDIDARELDFSDAELANLLDEATGVDEDTRTRTVGKYAKNEQPVVKAAVAVAAVETVETALQLTGERNRGAALVAVCQAYVEAHANGRVQGQRESDQQAEDPA